MTFDPDKALELLDRVKSEDPNYEPRWILQEYLWSNAESICRELATARSAADRLHDERFAEARKVDALTEQRHHYRSALARANAEMARQGRLAKDQRDAILETHKEAARNQQAAFEQWNAEMDTLRRELEHATRQRHEFSVQADALAGEREQLEGARLEAERLRGVMLSRHGGEPLALLEELDAARADHFTLRGELADAREELLWERRIAEEVICTCTEQELEDGHSKGCLVPHLREALCSARAGMGRYKP